MSYVELKNVSKIYTMGENKIIANNDISFDIDERDFNVIVGASGAGKSTILNILGGMDRPTKGEVFVDGQNIANFSEKDLIKYRRYDVGFVFQFYNLVPNLTTLENVELATELSKSPLDAREVLEQVGLSNRLNNFPSQLSGGEQQRAAIARAIAKNPKLLLCDEPTGALDYHTGKQILKLLHSTIEKFDSTVIVITHNKAIAPMADKLIEIADARVRDISTNENPQSIDLIEW
ncbi:ABC transporter ATP-binding protein [Neofamilia massiliensis]|uniref:ABC transporter ATP-binding protein n=1 Tax=Neofamilia massiliensis TaxID=1673724 RepID=UPI0006BB700F|nr:ABC transporter ATP-binding protein [Neofamilia massiliensis]